MLTKFKFAQLNLSNILSFQSVRSLGGAKIGPKIIIVNNSEGGSEIVDIIRHGS